MIRNIDELKNLQSYNGAVDWYSFIDSMEISEEQKEKRARVANDLFFLFVSMFVLAETVGDVEITYSYLYDGLRNIIMEYGRYDSYSMMYLDRFTEEYIAVTFRHDEEYFTSDDRALLGALNESNAIVGYDELQEAVDDGATYKIWVTERDNKVRNTHREVDGKRIPIDEFFEVGNERMMFPRDEVNCEDLNEIANCRCVLHFE